MAYPSIRPGDHVLVRNALGAENERRAVTGVIDGWDFAVVWVCTDEEWTRATAEGGSPEAIPFPADDVRSLAVQ